jgi:hypothetical protein
MRSSVCILTLSAIVALVGCDDPVDTIDLSEAQAAELAGAVFQQSLVNALAVDWQQPAQAPDGPQLASYTATVEAGGPCPLGGEVAVTGDIDVETDDQSGAGSLDFGLTVVHASCVVQGAQGTQFTLTGNPSLVLDFMASTDGETFGSFSGSIDGAVDYVTDDDEDGACSITYDFSGESSQNGFSFQTDGMVCGYETG